MQSYSEFIESKGKTDMHGLIGLIQGMIEHVAALQKLFLKSTDGNVNFIMRESTSSDWIGRHLGSDSNIANGPAYSEVQNFVYALNQLIHQHKNDSHAFNNQLLRDAAAELNAIVTPTNDIYAAAYSKK